jgi:hypothetical protein
LCFEALREAQQPLSTQDLLNYAARQAGVMWRSAEDRAKIRQGVKNAMRLQARKARIARVTRLVRDRETLNFGLYPPGVKG